MPCLLSSWRSYPGPAQGANSTPNDEEPFFMGDCGERAPASRLGGVLRRTAALATGRLADQVIHGETRFVDRLEDLVALALLLLLLLLALALLVLLLLDHLLDDLGELVQLLHAELAGGSAGDVLVASDALQGFAGHGSPPEPKKTRHVWLQCICQKYMHHARISKKFHPAAGGISS